MVKKILGIFVCMLLLATTLPVVGTMVNNKEPTESQLSISIEITDPKEGGIYIGGSPIVNFPFISRAVILGPITFKINIIHELPIECVDWYVDGVQEEQYTYSPYDWSWALFSGFAGPHVVMVEVIDHQGNSASDTVKVLKYF